MRIVYLDEPTHLPDEWRDRFARIGEFEVFTDRPDEHTAACRLSGADLAIVEWTHLTPDLLRQVTRLRYLTLATSSFDYVDLAAAAAAGIVVAHCPMYSRHAVAEHVFALSLSLARHLGAANAATRSGARHLYQPFLGQALHGRTLGLVGTGRIATAVAKIAEGFGMRVIAANRTGTPINGLHVLDIDDMLRQSDILSLHVPLNHSTHGLLDARRLALLRPSATIVNTCRGELIDQAVLVRMLATGRLAGAGLDDITNEGVDVLRTLDNVILTPGTAWYTETSRTANLQEIHDNLVTYLTGRPVNVLTAP